MKEILENLGLNKGEINVYLVIFRNKRIKPAELSKLTKIKRTTIYSITKSLISRGFIVEDVGKGRKEFVLADSNDIKLVLRKEENDFKKKEELFKRIIDDLENSSIGKSYNPPRIRFIEEDKIGDYMLSRNKVWNDSILKYDKHWWGFQDHTFLDKHTKWVDSFWKQASKDLHLKLLSNESDIERRIKGKYPNREVKYWSKGNFTATTWVVGDYLILIRTDNSPFYLVEIHDSILASNMRELFKNIWDLV